MAQVINAVGSRSPNLPPPPPLDSPQYGPAWIADYYGNTHDQRIETLVTAGWTINPDDRDGVAVAYARLISGQ